MTPREARRQKFAARFDTLLREAEEISESIETRTGTRIETGIERGRSYEEKVPYDYEVFNKKMSVEWMTKCTALLGGILSANYPNREQILEAFGDFGNATAYGFRGLWAHFRALKDNFDAGFLDDIWLTIRAEMSADYLMQCRTLLNDGCHIPVAVLAGAVLESTLREVAQARGLDTEKPNGKAKTIDPLNTDLQKDDAYASAKAQEIRGWAALRNDAAHGKPDKVDSGAVERMLAGVTAFVDDFRQ